MLSESPIENVVVLSVHDELEPLHFFIPNVTPSRYDIPGLNAPKDIFDACKFSFPGETKPFQYAVKRTKNNRPYVLIKIAEAKSNIFGTEEQKIDEYGQKLSPSVMRVPVPTRAKAVANEIERQMGRMGIKAYELGPEGVTEDMVLDLEKINVDFMRNTVADTNRLYKKSPLNVTKESVRRAWRLHKLGLLDPMPEWAQANPDALASLTAGTFNCKNCSKLLRVGIIKCDCGVVYDWKGAVDSGLVKPSDVPPSKRAEAGLEAPPEGYPAPPPAEPEEDIPMTEASAAPEQGSAEDLARIAEEVADEQPVEDEPSAEQSEVAST